MDDAKAQLADKLRNANNILVTVSRDPSIDQLASCIALTLLLNKQGKHAAAVFSGQVPSTLEFLQPEDTLEKTTDSLRDFIISLDKSKADKLRYKVEDSVVRIFITPYKTSITKADLAFTQGDFNVDVVVTLGVHLQEDLDEAITAHGRILHDATITSINTTPEGGLGAINWHEPRASSLCELVTDLMQFLDDDPELLDEQIATALLTGIIAETERFSNHKTTSQTMSTSALLMSAGANQQLVVTKLETPELIPPSTKSEVPVDEAGDEAAAGEPSEGPAAPGDGVIEINHKDKQKGKARKGKGKGADDQAPEAELVDDTADGNSDGASDGLSQESSQDNSPPQGDDTMKTDEPAESLELPLPSEGNDTQPANLDVPAEAAGEQGSESGAELETTEAINPISSLSSGSKLITEPPTLGGMLTANSQRDQLDPSMDPLSGGSKDQTLLKRKRRSKPLSTAAVPTLVDEFEASAPTISADDGSDNLGGSLAELEDSVKNPADTAQAEDLSEARDEVNRALNDGTVSGVETQEPIQALGAQPFAGDLHPEAASVPPPYQPSEPSSFTPAPLPTAFDPSPPPAVPPMDNPSSQPPAGFPPFTPNPEPLPLTPPPANDTMSPYVPPSSNPAPVSNPQATDPAAPPPVPPPIPFQFGNPNPPQ